MVTVFLSSVLLAISVTELLCCFKIIHEVETFARWKVLFYYLFTESLPSIAISSFFKTRMVATNEQVQDPYEMGGNHRHMHTSEPQISTDSEFGNFNPNLKVRRLDASEELRIGGSCIIN